MKKKLGIIAAVLAASLSSPVGAVINGNELLEICNSDSHGDIRYCTGFIHGALATFKDIDYFVMYEPTPICLPGGVGTQIVDVVVQYLQEHPELLNLSASSISNAALYKAFPCNKGD